MASARVRHGPAAVGWPGTMRRPNPAPVNVSVSRSSAAGSAWPVTTGTMVASQAAAWASAPDSQPGRPPPAAGPPARPARRPGPGALPSPRPVRWPPRPACPAGRPGPRWTWTWVGWPPRAGSMPVATSRRQASSSASWRRCAAVRVSSGPAFLPNASSTAASAAAQPGLRSPCARPAPENVMPRWKFRSPKPSWPSSRSGPRVRWWIASARRPRSARSAPSVAAWHQQPVRVVSDTGGQPVGPAAQLPRPGRGELTAGQRASRSPDGRPAAASRPPHPPPRPW